MKRTATSIAAVVIATTWMLAACSKTEPAGQPAANAPAIPASAPGTKANDDLARLRELMEQEDARKQAAAEKDKAMGEAISKALRAPVNTFGR